VDRSRQSDGMGNAICLMLAKEGCDIVSADMDLEVAIKTAESRESTRPQSQSLSKVNITVFAEAEELICGAERITVKSIFLVNTRLKRRHGLAIHAAETGNLGKRLLSTSTAR